MNSQTNQLPKTSSKTKIILSKEKATSYADGFLAYFRSRFDKAYENSGRIFTDFYPKSVIYHKNGAMILCIDETNSTLAKNLSKNQITWYRLHYWNELAIDVFRFLENPSEAASNNNLENLLY